MKHKMLNPTWLKKINKLETQVLYARRQLTSNETCKTII